MTFLVFCFFKLQVVDMRWGVRDDATDAHMTTELCLREIKACQEISVGPNFVVSIWIDRKLIFLSLEANQETSIICFELNNINYM